MSRINVSLWDHFKYIPVMAVDGNRMRCWCRFLFLTVSQLRRIVPALRQGVLGLVARGSESTVAFFIIHFMLFFIPQFPSICSWRQRKRHNDWLVVKQSQKAGFSWKGGPFRWSLCFGDAWSHWGLFQCPSAHTGGSTWDSLYATRKRNGFPKK